MNNTLIFGIGFSAQILFSARMIVQWIQSERAGKVLSPVLFWQLSLGGSFLLIIYGVLRLDVVIAGGQFVLYCIYIRNLILKKAWQGRFGLTVLYVVLPLAAVVWLLFSRHIDFHEIITGADIPSLLLFWGAFGQVVFSLRFVYQWIYSERCKESVLPAGFWVISLVGSFMLILYAVFRLDPVIFIGQLFGTVVYSRNIYLHYSHSKSN
jgi:lipid-A-disaccharide synthase-like uncharacterized protein